MALTRATKEALWLQRLLADIEGKTRGAVTIRVDNMGCIAMAKNPEGHERSKHIDIQVHFIRKHVGTQRVLLKYCPTEEMNVDFLTKVLPRTKHEWCVGAAGLKKGSSSHCESTQDDNKETPSKGEQSIPRKGELLPLEAKGGDC